MSVSNAVADVSHDLEKALDDAARGKRDPEAMRKVIEEMNRSREETRQRIGIVNVSVDLIRDARDQ